MAVCHAIQKNHQPPRRDFIRRKGCGPSAWNSEIRRMFESPLLQLSPAELPPLLLSNQGHKEPLLGSGRRRSSDEEQHCGARSPGSVPEPGPRATPPRQNLQRSDILRARWTFSSFCQLIEVESFEEVDDLTAVYTSCCRCIQLLPSSWSKDTKSYLNPNLIPNFHQQT